MGWSSPEAAHAYYKANRERFAAKNKAYHEANREKVLAAMAARYNKDAAKARREANPVAVKRRRDAHRERDAPVNARATRTRELWSAGEDRVALDDSLTNRERASLLSRSTDSVARRRTNLKKKQTYERENT